MASNGRSVRHNYEQIDTIRFITICFIIWGHSLIGWESAHDSGLAGQILRITVIQSGKISTVIFFVVAGFLLRPKLQAYTLKTYFKERFPRLYLPWFFFLAFFMVLCMFQQIPIVELWHSGNRKEFIKQVYNVANGLVLYTAYWFMISYMVSMSLIVMLRKYSESNWVGIALGAITLFYCINLYYGWIEVNHSKAIVAYASFVWAGMQLNKQFNRLTIILNKTPWWLMGVLLALLFSVSCYEGYYLSATGCADPYASNRFSNILFSFAFLFALLKIGKIDLVNKLKPRKTVYGIYLVHNILIFEFSVLIIHYFSSEIEALSIWTLLGYQVIFFTFIVAITWYMVSLLANSRYRWVVGVRPVNRL